MDERERPTGRERLEHFDAEMEREEFGWTMSFVLDNELEAQEIAADVALAE